jgi:hypothetical protein
MKCSQSHLAQLGVTDAFEGLLDKLEVFDLASHFKFLGVKFCDLLKNALPDNHGSI